MELPNAEWIQIEWTEWNKNQLAEAKSIITHFHTHKKKTKKKKNLLSWLKCVSCTTQCSPLASHWVTTVSCKVPLITPTWVFLLIEDWPAAGFPLKRRLQAISGLNTAINLPRSYYIFQGGVLDNSGGGGHPCYICMSSLYWKAITLDQPHWSGWK